MSNVSVVVFSSVLLIFACLPVTNQADSKAASTSSPYVIVNVQSIAIHGSIAGFGSVAYNGNFVLFFSLPIFTIILSSKFL